MDEYDDSLARLYRRSSREEPPAQVDLAVMEMARRASSGRAPWSPFGNHRLATGAVAGVALVSVVLVVYMQGQSSLTVIPETARDSVALRMPEADREQALDDGSIRLPLPPPGKLTDSDAPLAGKAPAGVYREQAEPPAAQPAAAQTSQTGVTGAQQPPESGPPQPRFNFYKSLPEMQVAVPPPAAVTPPQPLPPSATVAAPEPPAGTPEAMDSQATAAPAGVPAPASVAAPSAEHVAGKAPGIPAAPPAGYYLQVGAFRAADSAGRFKSRLEAMRLPASVEAIELANRETWHRVRVGPYADVAATEAVRSRLKAQGIDSLLVKTTE